MNTHEIIENYKNLQSEWDGWLLHCPCCGEQTMRHPITSNALSRREDIYICNKCGMKEALEDFIGKQAPLSDWDLLKSFKEGEK